EEMTQRAIHGDPACREIVTACGRKLGEGLALLIDLLNPEKIAMGGMAVRLGELVLAPARAVVKHEALPATSATCQIVAAELGEKIGDVASLCVAMRATPA
ncbi:MAG: ROK family protein, partial [Calditrichaeota bacterium]